MPDLAGGRRTRVPENFLAEDAPAVDLAPDWICGVIFERTQAHDRGKKRRIYLREGVGHYWLADPRDRTVEVETYEGDAIVRAEPFDAVDLDLSALCEL